MELNTIKLPEHFLLYCALFYNHNRTIDYNDVVSEVSAQVVAALAQINFEKIDMPRHSYHYLMGMLNPIGYESDGKVMYQPENITQYLNALAGVDQLQAIYKSQEIQLDAKLNAYREKFDYIQPHFKTYFDFEPGNSKFILTRNWDASGKYISTKDNAYIFVGWRIKGLKAKQIMHEITHAFINECELPIPEDINTVLESVPAYVKGSYAVPKLLAEESFIRALVIYLDRLEGGTFEFSFNEDDLSMQLPARYLDKLEKDRPRVVSKDFIRNFILKK